MLSGPEAVARRPTLTLLSQLTTSHSHCHMCPCPSGGCLCTCWCALSTSLCPWACSCAGLCSSGGMCMRPGLCPYPSGRSTVRSVLDFCSPPPPSSLGDGCQFRPNRFCPPPPPPSPSSRFITASTATESAFQPPVTAAVAALETSLEPPSPSSAGLRVLVCMCVCLCACVSACVSGPGPGGDGHTFPVGHDHIPVCRFAHGHVRRDPGIVTTAEGGA